MYYIVTDLVSTKYGRTMNRETDFKSEVEANVESEVTRSKSGRVCDEIETVEKQRVPLTARATGSGASSCLEIIQELERKLAESERAKAIARQALAAEQIAHAATRRSRNRYQASCALFEVEHANLRWQLDYERWAHAQTQNQMIQERESKQFYQFTTVMGVVTHALRE